MRHTNFKEKDSSFKVINTENSTLNLWKFTLADGLVSISSPAISSIGDYYISSIDTPDSDCFLFVVWGDIVEIIRVGNTDILLVMYATEGEVYEYKHISASDGSEISSGNMVEISDGFFYVEPTSLEKSFFDILGNITTLSVPYSIITCTGGILGASENFVNTGYNMFAFSGNRHSYFDSQLGEWVDDENVNAKASDLAKAVCHKYGLEWSDRDDNLWIGNYIKYLRTYYENDNQKVFKLYAPSITPEGNSNNFELVQDDENGNMYLRGVSILLIQDLDSGDDGSDGTIITFKG